MAYNFLARDRDQPFLLPPDLRDWINASEHRHLRANDTSVILTRAARHRS
jgi:hypothetical protein